MNKYNIAVVGVTGMVGNKFLEILDELNIPIDNLYLYASHKSAGKEILFKGKKYIIEALNEKNILNKAINYALFSAGGSISEQFAPIFSDTGAIVIDNSSQFRMDATVPLVVPEVNIEDAYLNEGIIANPNCSTIQAVLPLKVLNDHYNLQSVVYTTYQAVSGSGTKGIEDLQRTSDGLSPINYPYPIYNNVLPHIDSFLDNGYTKEEIKMINETRKILHISNLNVTATCVRVPVLNAHSVEILVELDKEFRLDDIRELLNNQEGIVVLDDPQNNIYPIPSIASGQNNIYVGRIRKDISNPKRLHIFTVADNIRKGAALNAVQILQKLIQRSEENV